jgi:uncharacterized protein YlxW (UPF0749 family)
MSGLPPIPVTEREDSMRLLYLVLDDANHTFGPPIPKGQKPRFRSVTAGVSLFIVIGIFFGIAFGLTRELVPIQETTRQELQQRILATQDQLIVTQELLADQIELLESVKQDVSKQSNTIQRINSNISQLNTVAGYSEVRGDGIRVTIQSSVNPSVEDGIDLGVVIDSDIARVVNGIFARGGIAVSINDHRITSTTAIRSAGEAILVGYQPLIPPYEILAIGNASRMLRELKTGDTGIDLSEISDRYGVRFTISEVSQISIPASITPLRNRVSVRIIE